MYYKMHPGFFRANHTCDKNDALLNKVGIFSEKSTPPQVEENPKAKADEWTRWVCRYEDFKGGAAPLCDVSYVTGEDPTVKPAARL